MIVVPSYSGLSLCDRASRGSYYSDIVVREKILDINDLIEKLNQLGYKVIKEK